MNNRKESRKESWWWRDIMKTISGDIKGILFQYVV